MKHWTPSLFQPLYRDDETHIDPTFTELMFSEGIAMTFKKLFTTQYRNCLMEVFTGCKRSMEESRGYLWGVSRTGGNKVQRLEC